MVIELRTLTEEVIGAAIEVHRCLGVGLLESVYEACLVYELKKRNVRCEKQVAIPVNYGNMRFECGFRADIIVEQSVILEIKCIENIHPSHKAQLLTYMKFSGLRLGLLINFNAYRLVEGIHRMKL